MNTDVMYAFTHITFILYSTFKLSFFSEFHKFVRGRFSEEPEDKKQNIISNIILVLKPFHLYLAICTSPLSSIIISIIRRSSILWIFI